MPPSTGDAPTRSDHDGPRKAPLVRRATTWRKSATSSGPLVRLTPAVGGRDDLIGFISRSVRRFARRPFFDFQVLK
jgi:hypothetical protein